MKVRPFCVAVSGAAARDLALMIGASRSLTAYSEFFSRRLNAYPRLKPNCATPSFSRKKTRIPIITARFPRWIASPPCWKTCNVTPKRFPCVNATSRSVVGRQPASNTVDSYLYGVLEVGANSLEN